MTRKEIIAEIPDAQAWFALSDAQRIDAVIAAETDSVWQNLKSGRQVKITATNQFTTGVDDQTGKRRTIRTHYFAYDYFPVEKLTREEQIARKPAAAKWFNIAAPDRAQLLAEEKPGSIWKQLTTGLPVTFRDYRQGNSGGPFQGWKAGTVIVTSHEGTARQIQDVDFIYNFYPLNHPQENQTHVETQHPPENAHLQPHLDRSGGSDPAAASPEKTPVKPFKPKKLGRMAAYRAVENYMTLVRRRDLNEDISVCGLCANTGMLKLGERTGALGEPLPPCEVPCICPNGQYMPWKTPGVPRGPL